MPVVVMFQLNFGLHSQNFLGKSYEDFLS